jgi:hypothetical protein
MTDTMEKDLTATLPDVTPVPEPKAAEAKPSEDGNPDGAPKELSKNALKKLAKGKVRLYIVLTVCQYLMAILLVLLTPPSQLFIDIAKLTGQEGQERKAKVGRAKQR